MKKHVLGLDLGTNSIGWALLNVDYDAKKGNIMCAGSRIIPMDAATLSDYSRGNTKSQTAERTSYRGMRRLRERFLLRRERLHRILNMLGFLPQHYHDAIGWDLEGDARHYGTFLDGEEPKIPWVKGEDGKMQFLFRDSFLEMVADFADMHSDMVSEERKVPYDWTLYYLRKKALIQPISKEELAWIILNFNQKRGYNQLRDEVMEKDDTKKMEFLRLTVKDAVPDEDQRGDNLWYNVTFENSELVYRRRSRQPLTSWIGKQRDIIVSTKLDANGQPALNRRGEIDRSIKMPSADDWTLRKVKTEHDILHSKKTVGEYIYDTILHSPDKKIRGAEVGVVERKFYKEELKLILTKQAEYHQELTDAALYENCINDLYKNNIAHRQSIASGNFVSLIIDDAIFFQRPLKTKKNQIEDCPLEKRSSVDKETGEVKVHPVKCIAKSNPLFQEFRVWQTINNIKITRDEMLVDGVMKSDVDVTAQLIDREALFAWLNDMETLKQDKLLAFLIPNKKERSHYSWNYTPEKELPINRTRACILSRLSAEEKQYLTPELTEMIWHLLYSTKTKQEIDAALLPERKSKVYRELSAVFSDESIERLKTIKFKDEGYGSYSAKAITKLLPGIAEGRIMHDLVNEIYGPQGDNKHWTSPQDVKNYLKGFRQHSMRNPIVESVVCETLRVIHDLWTKQLAEDPAFRFDEIHVEMSRDMKNPKEKRARMAENMLENEATNLRIKALLQEFAAPDMHIEGVRSYSPSQRDILRIYEEQVLMDNEVPEDIEQIRVKLSSPSTIPSHSQVVRYKCWLDQKYVSPYTGRPIPLARLFTKDYEIEHIIPQSRFFDNSMSNKVICESAINNVKDNRTAHQFISNCGDTMIGGIHVRSLEEYESYVKETFKSYRQRKKRDYLLTDDIPSDFSSRQDTDTKYIARTILGLMGSIVNEPATADIPATNNVVSVNGTITDRLKTDWGINDVWNHIVLPRFNRMNGVMDKDVFTTQSAQGHTIPCMPLELQAGFSKKRIDHRHHAMDAIVIAATSRNHVNLLNNIAASGTDKGTRYDLNKLLRNTEMYDKDDGTQGKRFTSFKMPWNSFAHDTHESLMQIVISYKQNLRTLTDASNKYMHYEDGKKVPKVQACTNHYSIRKPLHKETVYGRVNLQQTKEVSIAQAVKQPERIVDKKLRTKVLVLRDAHFTEKQLAKYFKDYAYEWKGYDLKKVKVRCFSDETEPMVATRFCNDLVSLLSKSKTSDKATAIISSITDTGIQKILLAHLAACGGDPEIAFSADGVELMNDNIVSLNNGKQHKPIYKVRVATALGKKFMVGQKGNKSKKYVVAAEGTNLYYGVYENQKGERVFETIPLNITIERKKQGLSPVPETDETDNRLLFSLSPNDLIYIPTEDEIANNNVIKPLDTSRIYRVVKFTGTRLYGTPQNIAKSLVDKIEFSGQNCVEFTDEHLSLKKYCIPVSINRLGVYELIK